jgi:hypothetical protein
MAKYVFCNEEGQLVADTKQKANILNEQFQSVFTTESTDNIPNKGVSPHPVIPSITITTPGIQKLLKKQHQST